MLDKTMITTGSYVYHPAYGPGKLLQWKKIIVLNLNFYVGEFSFIGNSGFVYIADSHIKKSGIRFIADAKRIQTAMKILQGAPASYKRNKSYLIYSKKLYSGDICQIAEIVKDIYKNSKLQKAEIKILYEKAFCNLTREICLAYQINVKQASSYIMENLSLC